VSNWLLNAFCIVLSFNNSSISCLIFRQGLPAVRTKLRKAALLCAWRWVIFFNVLPTQVSRECVEKQRKLLHQCVLANRQNTWKLFWAYCINVPVNSRTLMTNCLRWSYWTCVIFFIISCHRLRHSLLVLRTTLFQFEQLYLVTIMSLTECYSEHWLRLTIF